jgi:hypothetical protein
MQNGSDKKQLLKELEMKQLLDGVTYGGAIMSVFFISNFKMKNMFVSGHAT